MSEFEVELALLSSYIGYAVWGRFKGSKEQRSTSLGCLNGALVLFLVTWFMLLITNTGYDYLRVKVIPTYIFHIIQSLVCLGWSYCMVKRHSAIYPAIVIFIFAGLQCLYAVDWFIYGKAPTELGRMFMTLAFLSHVAILIATHVNGITLHTIAIRRGHRELKAL